MKTHSTPSKAKLLYVEDEVIVALDVADGLRDELGFDVHVAHTLAAADSLRNEADFDFALLDVNLGHGEKSFDLGRDLSQKGVKVVFASGYNREEIDAIANFPLIEKPFQIGDIAKAFSVMDQTDDA